METLTTRGSRLFVFAHGSVQRCYVFEWNTNTGRLLNNSNPIQILDNSQIGPMPTGHAWGAIVRTRFRPLDPFSPCGTLYAAGTRGTLLEFEYQPTSVPPLRYRSSWHSSYVEFLQDCRLYDMGQGPRLLTVKDQEGFALVVPGTNSCP
jgi:hypothetical protein